MKKPQGVAHHEIKHGQYVRLTSGILTEESGLTAFHVPVAKLAPEKPVQRPGGISEPIGFKRSRHLTDRLVQTTHDPFVITGEQRGIDFAFDFTALHLAETAGVPQLVAEVTTELHVLFIEENIQSLRRAAHGTEAQSVRAVLGNKL